MPKMGVYKLRELVQATQWFKNGDHPRDYQFAAEKNIAQGWEGDIVRRFRHPRVPGKSLCTICNHAFQEHGWIDQCQVWAGNEGGICVCPGDYVITDPGGTFSVVKPEAFANLYILVKWLDA